MFRPTTILAAMLAVLGGPCSGRAQEPPSLEVTAVGTTDGHARLAWTPAPGSEDAALEFELQGADTADFHDPLRCYLGPARASFRSGLAEGTRYYRVRQRPAEGDWGPWSVTASVDIRPYPLHTAWSLFGVGAVLVGSILGYLLWQGRAGRELPAAAGGAAHE